MVSAQLEYPEKYEHALHFFHNWPPQARQASEETQLVLDALGKQVARGACTEAKPFWNKREVAKWQAWTHLGNMNRMEAMRLFVKTLEEDEPNWFNFLSPSPSAAGADAGGADGGPTCPNGPLHAIGSLPEDDSWRSPWTAADGHPHTRFEHGAALLGHTVYIIGGNCAGGRYLADVWSLALEPELAWSDLTAACSAATDAALEVGEADGAPRAPNPAVLPPTAAAVAVAYRGQLLVVGGHTKDKTVSPMKVRSLDPATATWGLLECGGEVPETRGGHVAVVVGDRLFVLGGENPRRRSLPGVAVLDLSKCMWSMLQPADGSGPGPSPRTGLVATAFRDRYVVAFAGGNVGACHADLWVLDTTTCTWHRPPVSGPAPKPRAGCCAALLGTRWFVLGGGNNVSGCPDMWELDLSALGAEPLAWRCVCSLDLRSPLASEGACLVASAAHNALIAFGGYNGVYHNTVSVFRPRGAARTPGAEADARTAATDGLENGRAPVARTSEIQPAASSASAAAREGVSAPERSEPAESSGKAAAVDAALAEAALAKDAMAQEVAIMRKQVAAAQAAQSAAEAEASDLRSEVTAERSRALRLEVQVSDLQAKLREMGDLEAELTRFRTLQAESEKKRSGGIWGYIAGS